LVYISDISAGINKSEHFNTRSRSDGDLAVTHLGTFRTTETLEEENERKEDWIFYDIKLVAGRKKMKFLKDKLLLLKACEIGRLQPGVGRAL